MFNQLKEKFFLATTRLILKGYAGKSQYQVLFEEFHSLSLRGMNIGRGGDPKKSGELNVLHIIKNKLKNAENLILFDVGANVGSYTELLKNTFDKNSTIYSFEPSKKTYITLNSNISQLSNVNLFNFGLGDENTSLTLYSNEEGSGLASVYDRELDHFNIKMDLKEEVELRTVDSFCVEHKINHINLLKIDVEGHELSVLHGSKEMLTDTKIDYIQFEFGGTDIDARIYFRDFFFLLSEDYFLYRIVKDGIRRIDKYAEIHEIFTTTNFLAERKTI